MSKATRWIKENGYEDPDTVDPNVVHEACAKIIGAENVPALSSFFNAEGRTTRYRSPNTLRTYVSSALQYKTARDLLGKGMTLAHDKNKLF